VAVKVLSHEGSRAAKLNALHEAVVSAHVHHPNVVSRRCFAAVLPPPKQLRFHSHSLFVCASGGPFPSWPTWTTQQSCSAYR
jgi:hypothetical protein